MHRATIPLTAVLLVTAAIQPTPVSAQGHPNLAVGLSSESTYDSSGIDNVSLFGGGLSVGPIPLGPRYTVSSTLSYGLSAWYSNNIWEFYPVEGTPYVEAKPSLGFDLGAGWTVTLGELWHPDYVYNTTGDWIFVDPSGGRHKLYQQLHSQGDDGDEGVVYSRDNGFIRMVQMGNFNVQRVETSDGLMRTFVKRGSRFRLEQIDDRHGNWVKICYGEAHCQDPANPVAEDYWEIRDKLGRVTYVFLRTDLHWVGPAIDTIDFPGPNGQRLLWTFDYRDDLRDRSCKDTDPETPSRLRMGLLVRINRPDGSKFEMLEGDAAAYWDGCDGGMYDRPGMLKRITLPTGGSIAYDYQRYDFPGGGHPPDYYQSATGVKTRQTFDRDGSLIGTTTYYTTLNLTEKEMVTRVVQPTGECSRHYFEAKPDPHPGTGAGWDYGLPYSRRFTAAGTSNRFLSSEIWTGSSGTQCSGTKLRSAYVKFESDPLPNLGEDPSNYYNTNRRLAGSRTVFHDAGDQHIDMALTGYDGVGHYRTSTTTSSDAFTPTRTVTTNVNPGRQPYTPWPVANPWILGTFNSTQAQSSAGVGNLVAKVELQFAASTGALECQRVLTSGTTRSGTDLVTQYTRDAAGNVTQVRTRGGDGAGLGTGAVCAGSGGYGANSTYTNGVVNTVRPVGRTGAVLGYLTYDVDIDPATGWVTASRDPSGLATSYVYDALGRVKTVTPQEGASSSTTYTNATATGPAKIYTQVTGAGVTLSESEVLFDGLGRTVESRRRTPDHGWVSVTTTYDAAGRVLTQSLPNDPAKKVQYLEYDPFGRPGRIRPPEGAGHDVVMSYTGIFGVERTVKVGTAGGKVPQTWIQQFDGLGRLRIVTEPGSIPGQETGETLRGGYDYDVAGRLTRARTVDGANGIEQVRTFVYDNRGFLLEETHPELGTGSGPGGFFYSGYDALGNPGSVTEVVVSPSSRNLTFAYDVFGRLATVRDANKANRVVKQFSYDTAAGRGQGKLATATRHNWVTPPGEALQNVQVTEQYAYQGTAGALSSRTTLVSRGGLQFREQYGYDAAGQLTGLTYPDCLHAGCGSDLPQRTVTFGYLLGHLKWVGAGFQSGPITYHPDGSWATIPRANGVTDVREILASNPSQTGRLTTTGASSNYGSGLFQYDGAGHIIQLGQDAFVYDRVGRLRGKGQKTGGTWDPADPPQIEWEWRYWYDAFGNLKQHTQTLPDGTNPTRTFAIDVQKNRLASASYDATGNLVSWGGGGYVYDESGNLQKPHAGLAYVYTPSDERIGRLIEAGGSKIEEYTLRSAGGQVLRKVQRDASMPPGELTWSQDYAWRGGQLLATVQPSAGGEFKRHFTLNHLGSPVLVTDWQGETISRYAEAPFGEDMTAAGDQDYFGLRFTGHERDYHNAGVLDDLDYMHARHYTPYIGRFLQVDPVLGSPGSPQSWNRYAYVGNDPVNATDPTGMLKRVCEIVHTPGGSVTTSAGGPPTVFPESWDHRCHYETTFIREWDPDPGPIGRRPTPDPTTPDPTNPDPINPNPTTPNPTTPAEPECQTKSPNGSCITGVTNKANLGPLNQVGDALPDAIAPGADAFVWGLGKGVCFGAEATATFYFGGYRKGLPLLVASRLIGIFDACYERATRP